ncbi:Hypothetical predicted protein [Marmota monax]|uniref:Uncharacterized protein n=1 Tax=Marmota monax TaxID=9995 RepID=A0A5E4AIG5_MARMO|nr:hypothetical protein GHT09_004370 [Marmota monax]VTJ57213.1 Hypothetical predicted protein [Marmota monax]
MAARGREPGCGAARCRVRCCCLQRAGRGASRSGDEERVAHPAQEPAAAGRLHCLTTPGRPCPGSSGWRKSPALAPCIHCGPCLCLLFWNVLRVLIPVTVTCKSKRHVPLEEKRAVSSGLKKKTGVLPV